MHNPPYTLQLPPHPHPHPISNCHSIQPFLHHPPRSPSYPFQSTSLNLVTPSHHFFNDNILSTRPLSSSGQSLPNELGLQHYLSKSHRSPRTPDQSPINTWPLPILSAVAPSPGLVINRPWPKTTGSNPEPFHPGVNTQPYHNYLLEPTDNNTNFSSESEAFPPAALPTQATSILGPDIPRPRYQPRDSVACFSGSESDSGQELEDERNIAHDARRDQWTSASTASPRARSPVMTLSRRFASFLATEVPTWFYLSARSAYPPIIGNKIRFKSSPERHRLRYSTFPPYPVVF
ncbi:hypothetical protein BGW80DRAFT_90177 [Lactifluus volemus]|nr:hypothetical protein BGW80DRAFT_90177 [Lactifluus volemus]